MDPGEEQRLDSSHFHLNYLSFSGLTHLVQVVRPHSKCLRLDRALPHGLLGRVELQLLTLIRDVALAESSVGCKRPFLSTEMST